MSIAQGARLMELERQMLELSRELTEAHALIRQLVQRLEAIENRPRPGRPPKEA